MGIFPSVVARYRCQRRQPLLVTGGVCSVTHSVWGQHQASIVWMGEKQIAKHVYLVGAFKRHRRHAGQKYLTRTL
ncbi:hypothetical protein CEXT_594321, partial [Caerostris extrusa]